MKTVKKLPQPVAVKNHRKSRIYLIVIECFVLSFFLGLHIILNKQVKEKKHRQDLLIAESGLADNKMIEVRNDEFQFIKPLLLADVKESEKLKELKQNISQCIEMKQKSGQLRAASVYFRKLDDGSWISINNEERFRPGSINKIPLMIYFLKMSEIQPGLLDKEYLYQSVIMQNKSETYHESNMVLGKSYKVRDLLSKMIMQSDNNATTLLLQHMDKPEVYRGIFSDLRMPVPEPNDFNFSLSAKDCSKFMRVLYSSTYLSEKNSQFALSLLSKSTFTRGLVKNLPGKVTVAHKFGESGFKDEPEFSETGIVYDGSDTYLITIMTKGSDSKQQADAISEISKLVYDKMNE